MQLLLSATPVELLRVIVDSTRHNFRNPVPVRDKWPRHARTVPPPSASSLTTAPVCATHRTCPATASVNVLKKRKRNAC